MHHTERIVGVNVWDVMIRDPTWRFRVLITPCVTVPMKPPKASK